MRILYKLYFHRLRLLRFSEVENSRPRATRRRVVLCTPLSGTCIIICQIYLSLSEVEMFFFCSNTLVSARRLISELTVPDFGRPM